MAKRLLMIFVWTVAGLLAGIGVMFCFGDPNSMAFVPLLVGATTWLPATGGLLPGTHRPTRPAPQPETLDTDPKSSIGQTAHLIFWSILALFFLIPAMAGLLGFIAMGLHLGETLKHGTVREMYGGWAYFLKHGGWLVFFWPAFAICFKQVNALDNKRNSVRKPRQSAPPASEG